MTSNEFGSAAAPHASTPPRALVTGGGGFLGFEIVSQLSAAGWQVRSLARGAYPELAARGVEALRGDVADADAVRRACRDCDVVFHVAAKAGLWGPYEDYYAANVRGTDNVIAACRAADVRRLVYTSSPSVVFSGVDLEGVDESVPYAQHPGSHYSATKALAEQRVLAAHQNTLRTCALRPHLIWGPRDNHIIPRIIRRARTGRLRIVGDGRNRVDVAYVSDAAAAHLAAAEALTRNPAAGGRAYFISQGSPVNAWGFINQILACADLPPLNKRISHAAARRLGAVCEFAYRVFRRRDEPPMTRWLADELATSHWFDISAARRLLSYEPRVSMEDGLTHVKAWLREHSV